MTGATWFAQDWYGYSMFLMVAGFCLLVSSLFDGLVPWISATAQTQATVGAGCILIVAVQRLEAVLEGITDFKREYWRTRKEPSESE